jgi:hypothetical protein
MWRVTIQKVLSLNNIVLFLFNDEIIYIDDANNKLT